MVWGVDVEDGFLEQSNARTSPIFFPKSRMDQRPFRVVVHLGVGPDRPILYVFTIQHTANNLKLGRFESFGFKNSSSFSHLSYVFGSLKAIY